MERACTLAELKKEAELGEACRVSAKRYADLPEGDLEGFLELRTHANAYRAVLQTILLQAQT